MDPFSADYLTNLAAELTADLLPALGRRLQAALVGDETTQAIERSLHKGIVALVAQASAAAPEQEALLADIFADFLRQDDVAREMARLLRGQEWDMEELALLFDEAGYDAAKLPGLDFAQGMEAFAAAFLVAAAAEPALQGTLQTHQLLAQTRLQEALVAQMQHLINALQNSRQVGIHAGEIRATNVVSGVQIIYQWPGRFVQKDSARVAYLTWLMRDRQNLSMRGIDVTAADATGTRRPPELANVYVALNTTTQVADEQEQRRRHDLPGEKAKPLTALAAAANNRQMVLLGDPGSGKSTFVNHLAFCLAAHALYPESGWLEKLPGWPADGADVLPMLITLRDFARWLPEPLPAKARAHHLWDFVADTLGREKLEAFLPVLEQALANGHMLWLLDGLDEVTVRSQRRFMRDAVLAFAKRYEGNRFLVTCRIWSYQPPDLDKEEKDLRLPVETYPVFTLADFDDDQRENFIHAWYRELQRQGHLPGRDITRLSRDLQQAIHLPDLRRLSGNPLLLTVMAIIHAHRGRLPDSRALLYEETIDLLLGRWEETKVEDELPTLRQLLQQANRADIDLKRRLGELAYEVHIQAGSGADNEKMADIGEAYLSAELSKLYKKDMGWGQALLEIIKTRAGLLIERTPGQFTFPHRTFQEYLAGTHLALQPAMAEEALELARQDVGWWPLVLFAVEYQVYIDGRLHQPLKLISLLCPKGEPDTPAGWQLVRLAGEALLSLGRERAEDSEWGQELANRVRRQVTILVERAHLSARERAEAGKTLGRLGDPRPGVGVNPATGLPDIAWGEEVPAGEYPIGDDESQYEDEKSRGVTIEQPYQLSRYPITNVQFHCFVEASDFADVRWWEGLPADEQDVSESAFPFANHPREMVSWYQAIAFCRWLSDKLGEEVDLPHEHEWEVAARHPDNRLYPWGDVFDPQKANTSEGERIGQTTAVGMYPAGRNPKLELYDLSGNVWEWCRNKYDDPKDTAVDGSSSTRVLRGGSWGYGQDFARAASRIDPHPVYRDLNLGFRVVRRPPSQ